MPKQLFRETLQLGDLDIRRCGVTEACQLVFLPAPLPTLYIFFSCADKIIRLQRPSHHTHTHTATSVRSLSATFLALRILHLAFEMLRTKLSLRFPSVQEVSPPLSSQTAG